MDFIRLKSFILGTAFIAGIFLAFFPSCVTALSESIFPETLNGVFWTKEEKLGILVVPEVDDKKAVKKELDKAYKKLR